MHDNGGGRLVRPAGPRAVEPGRVGRRVERPVGLRHQQPPVVLERLVQLRADGRVLSGHVARLARVRGQVEQARLAGRARGTGARPRGRRVAPHRRLVPHGQYVPRAQPAAADVRQRVGQLRERPSGRAVQHRRRVVRRPRPGRPEISVQCPVGRRTCNEGRAISKRGSAVRVESPAFPRHPPTGLVLSRDLCSHPTRTYKRVREPMTNRKPLPS